VNCSDFKQMLDLYIDGELDANQQKALKDHAAQCSDCQKELAASEQLREILSHMDDDISVPLPAQAAWRNAVRTEAKRSRMKKIYSICGAVAAVCMLTIGVTAMLGNKEPVSVITAAPRVESDGVSKDTGSDAMVANENISLVSVDVRSLDYISRMIEADDAAQAYDYLGDVIAEYGGMIERETDGDERKVFVQVPGENIADFISAVDSLGTVLSGDDAIAVDESAASVGVCVTIVGA